MMDSRLRPAILSRAAHERPRGWHTKLAKVTNQSTHPKQISVLQLKIKTVTWMQHTSSWWMQLSEVLDARILQHTLPL